MNELKIDPELVSSLIKARSEFPEIPKNKTAKAGSFSYKYADLGDILPAVVPALLRNGLTIIQTIDDQKIVTIIAHKSGSTISSSCPLPMTNLTAQQLGAWVTYLKRYSLCAVLNIHPEDDLDGQGAEAAKPQPKAAPVVIPKKATFNMPTSDRNVPAQKDFDDEDIPF